MPRGRQLRLVPFEGELPAVKPGDRVMCRPAWGRPEFEATAFSAPRYDRRRAFWPNCYLTVSIGPYAPGLPYVNWPAEDVRYLRGWQPGDPQTPVDLPRDGWVSWHAVLQSRSE